ncbi:CCHC-type domain-containing protein [Abeliophyllum distichum]|uniref:CCHC-type domain-containing protein n=1 Tax=Abeliophyllum distichum TaxID=126358 RepID=A0ABD1QXV7_9LAMI
MVQVPTLVGNLAPFGMNLTQEAYVKLDKDNFPVEKCYNAYWLDEEYNPIMAQVNGTYQNTSSYNGRGNRGGRSLNSRDRTRGRGIYGRPNKVRHPCQICGLSNRTTPWCYNIFDEKYIEKRPSDQNRSSNSSTYTASPNSVEDQAWYVDSGASHHVTTDKDNVDKAKEYGDKFGNPMVTRSKAGIVKPKVYTADAISHSLDEIEPISLDEVLKSEKWCKAMKEEYDALIKNQTWVLVSSEP